VFDWVLGLINVHGLVDGKTLGVDSTTLEANAAMNGQRISRYGSYRCPLVYSFSLRLDAELG